MNDPIVSLLLPGIRPQYWGEICTTLEQQNACPFEIIFMSPLDPLSKIPSYHKYFKTDMKVPRAIEAGCRIARGKYVLHIADDMQFVPKYLDSLLHLTNATDMNENVIIPHIGKIKRKKKWIAKVKGRYHGSNESWPIVGLYAFMKRDIWRELGGLDRRFEGTCWNNDLVLRFYQQGGKHVLSNSKTCLAVESRPGCVGLTRKFGAKDWKLIEKLWHPKGVFLGCRTKIT